MKTAPDPTPRQTQPSYFIPLAIGVGIPTLFFIFRFTAAATLFIFILGCLFFPLHRNLAALHIAFALFVVTILIPVDVHVPGFHGRVVNSKHSGLRFVRVMYGLTSGPLNDSEAILGGCIVGLHDSQWRLVWD